MNKIDIEELLKTLAQNIKANEEAHSYDDNSVENNYYKNNITKIRDALAKGLIDPDIVTKDMIECFMVDEIDFTDYEEREKEYCEENGIDYEKYKVDRKQIIDQLSEKSPKPQMKLRTKRIASEIEKELEDDMGEDYVTSLKERYPRQYDRYSYIIEQHGPEYPDAFELNEDDRFLVRRIKAMLKAKHGKKFLRQIKEQHPEDYNEYLLETYNEDEVVKYEEEKFAKQIEEMLIEKHGEAFVNQIREQHQKDYNQYLIDEYEIELRKYEARQEAPVGPVIVLSKKRTRRPKLQKTEDGAVEEVGEFLKDAAQQAALPENVDIKNNWMSLMRNWIKNITNTIKNTFQRQGEKEK